MAATLAISSAQLRRCASSMPRESEGSSGSRAICTPMSVIAPFASMAPRTCSWRRASSRLSTEGGSKKSKRSTSISSFSVLRCSTVPTSEER
eukprot:8264679-Pyramimonas_sp.AAC.1